MTVAAAVVSVVEPILTTKAKTPALAALVQVRQAVMEDRAITSAQEEVKEAKEAKEVLAQGARAEDSEALMITALAELQAEVLVARITTALVVSQEDTEATIPLHWEATLVLPAQATVTILTDPAATLAANPAQAIRSWVSQDYLHYLSSANHSLSRWPRESRRKGH